jgi:hypothetical protein
MDEQLRKRLGWLLHEEATRLENEIRPLKERLGTIRNLLKDLNDQ